MLNTAASEDWTDPDFQAGYQAFDNYQRDIARDSAEVRWLSRPDGQIANSDWLIGLYTQQSTIALTVNTLLLRHIYQSL